MHDEWSREIVCVQWTHCITFYLINIFIETAFLDLSWAREWYGCCISWLCHYFDSQGRKFITMGLSYVPTLKRTKLFMPGKLAKIHYYFSFTGGGGGSENGRGYFGHCWGDVHVTL